MLITGKMLQVCVMLNPLTDEMKIHVKSKAELVIRAVKIFFERLICFRSSVINL